MKYFARKTACQHGHTHASAREAKRCGELHLLFRAGHIDALTVEPVYHFPVNGGWLTMGNGHRCTYTPDFSYLEGNRLVVEDVKAKNGFMERDVSVKFALMRACYPYIELRVTK